MVSKRCQFLWRPLLRLILLLVLVFPAICPAAETTLGLTVRESGTSLYSRQELDADRIATLQKGAVLTPLAEAIGQQTWYMVKTQDGLFGWVRATDVSGADELKASFNEQKFKEQRVSTWSAQTATGRIFEGGWSVDPASSPDKASGTWTLGESADKILLRGTWSVQKFSTGWSGTWRAAAENQRREFTGSWTADFPNGPEASMDELFLTAARNAIRGIWSANGDFGSWVIQAAQ